MINKQTCEHCGAIKTISIKCDVDDCQRICASGDFQYAKIIVVTNDKTTISYLCQPHYELLRKTLNMGGVTEYISTES